MNLAMSFQKQNLAPWLRQMDKWSFVEGELWEAALDRALIVTKPKGTKFIIENDCSDVVRYIIVLSGTIKNYGSSPNGRDIGLSYSRVGDACPLCLSYLMRNPIKDALSVAVTDVTLLCISKDDFDKIYANCEPFRLALIRDLADFANAMVNLVKEVSFIRLPVRLANHLIKLSDNYSSSKIAFTHQELADELGTTREVTSRMLKDLEIQGLLKLNRGSVEIHCKKRLDHYISTHMAQ